jgi:murein DD-endopeptidase MepM/ murein hydrolase activator NlpD
MEASTMLNANDLHKAWDRSGRFLSPHARMQLTEDGLTLGADTVIVPLGRDEWERPILKIDGNEERILALLSIAHDQPVLPNVIGNLRNASRCLCKGDLALAYIHLAFTGLQPLEDADAPRRLFMAGLLLDDGMDEAEMLKGLGLFPRYLTPWSWRQVIKEFNPDQARDALGRWVAEGEAAVASVISRARDAIRGPKAEGEVPSPSQGGGPDTPRINSAMPPKLPSNTSSLPSETAPANSQNTDQPQTPVSVAGLPTAASPVPDPQIRGQDTSKDGFGSGAFGASRDGGIRPHQGVDLVADPGTEVTSPVTGTVIGTFDPYRRSPNPAKHDQVQGISIRADDGSIVNMMYVGTDLQPGAKVVAGETKIGTTQSLQGLYPGIQDHVHFEIKRKGVAVDPTPLVRAWQKK